MSRQVEQAARSFYLPLRQAASAARRVGWESDALHAVRLRAAVEAVGPLEESSSLLDAGCGEGALLDVLDGLGWRGRYRGEDILSHMIERARERRPDADLAVADATIGGPEADAVVCSGTFNTGPSEGHTRAVVAAMEALWSRARRVLVVDLAVADRHAGGSSLAVADLQAVWSAARRVAPVVAVREDVLPGEALLVLRRDRADGLRRWLPNAPVERARVHLAAGEHAAAREALAGEAGPDAALWRAVALAASGRIRDAERTLRALADDETVGPRARLHLAALLGGTRRPEEATALLAGLTHGDGEVADEARLLLARHLAGRGAEREAAEVAAAIRDPWIAREAADVL
ncbi:MAG: methyltransferase domain-containing protein [Myxococcota bacterium]